MDTTSHHLPEAPRALPGDEARRILWRFTGRDDVQRLVESVRAVARGPVARLVSGGARGTREWTEEKNALLAAFDEAGITAAFLDPSHGGTIAEARHLALALIAFELAWVDAGAATTAIAQQLAVAPILARGSEQQRRRYAAAPGRGLAPRRGALAVTEPIPNVGADLGMLAGKVRVAEWSDGEEPLLQVDKRGRFITNMAFADYVVAAVDSGDDRIKGTCLVILETDDPGVFDRGPATRKLMQQLSSTSEPTFSLRVPASRIVGGYTTQDGVLVPNGTHAQILEAVFRASRVMVGLMTAAKLLSAVEPVLRYQRARFRGAEAAPPGTAQYELGLQQREDAQHRLLDVWAAGEASASLGFAAARLLDELASLEPRKRAFLEGQGVRGATAEGAVLRRAEKDAAQQLRRPGSGNADDLQRFVLVNAAAKVLAPACKLWNTSYGGRMLREAVSLVGGSGLMEDSPGFLGYKWMDSQLEAIYEGPEAVHRRQLSITMTDEVFLAQFAAWIVEMRDIANHRPGTGACTVASAMELWLWTLQHLLFATDADGERLYQVARHGITFPLADALCWLLASRCQVLDVLELERAAREGTATVERKQELAALAPFLADLCHVQAARAAGEVGRIAAELVHGYNRHPAWDAEGCRSCYGEAELAGLEQLIPGIESTAGSYGDVIALDGAHKAKAGPCVRFQGVDDFVRLRGRMDGCLTGFRLAKDRAARALTKIPIPEDLDYPR